MPKPPPLRNSTREAEEVILLLKDGPMSYQDIAEKLGIAKDAARKRVGRMSSRGEIRKNPDGKYELIDVQVSDLSECPVGPTLQ